MKVALHYGKGIVTLRIPQENVGDIIRPWQSEQDADNTTLLSQALACRKKDDFAKEVAGNKLGG